jgi:hypothetical protein
VAFLFGVLGSAPAVGQPQSSWSGPTEGFVFDSPTNSIRPIVGMPGAAYLGLSVLNNLDAAWIAPSKQHGIATQSGQVLLVSSLGSNPPITTVLNGVVGQPEGVRWSADGSVAVLYSASGSWIQRLTNLPDSPSAGPSTDLSALGGVVSAVASDAQGRRVLIGIRSQTAGGVYLASDDQAPQFRTAMTDPSALAFSDNTDIQYAADRATGQLFELRNSGATPILTADQGAADTVAIRSGADSRGQRLFFLASRAGQAIRVYDAASYAKLDEIALETPPAGLDPLGDNSLLIAARTRDGDAVWLLSRKPPVAVYFVPTPVASGGGQP